MQVMADVDPRRRPSMGGMPLDFDARPDPRLFLNGRGQRGDWHARHAMLESYRPGGTGRDFVAVLWNSPSIDASAQHPRRPRPLGLTCDMRTSQTATGRVVAGLTLAASTSERLFTPSEEPGLALRDLAGDDRLGLGLLAVLEALYGPTLLVAHLPEDPAASGRFPWTIRLGGPSRLKQARCQPGMSELPHGVGDVLVGPSPIVVLRH